MPYPRSTLVSLEATPWYHVISRCMRRAFLCGEDRATWCTTSIGAADRRAHGQLAGVFAVDVAAYAVMSNHIHQVVRVDAERARAWSDDEVFRRWTKLYTGPELVADMETARVDIKAPQGRDGFRLRVGKWRVIYHRDDNAMIILVVDSGSRGDIYK